jgi:hypothetical protein
LTCSSNLFAPSRGIVVFTEQSPVLKNNAQHLGYKSNLWVEDSDRFWTQKLTSLKKSDPPQRATEIAVSRIYEYYNLDCIAPESIADLHASSDTASSSDSAPASSSSASTKNGDAAATADPTQHSSFTTKAPFGKAVAEEFENCARQRGYTSHMWVTAGLVRSRNIALLPGAKIASVQFPGKGRFYNAEQFEHPARLEATPISAYKRLPYGGAALEALRGDMAARGWRSGLYFTLGQLELFDLTGRLADGAEPVEVTGEFGQPFNPTLPKHRLFNVDEVRNGEDLLDELNRFPVEEDTFLISGNPVADAGLLAGLARVRPRYSTRYWVTQRDVEARGYALKPDAVGVSRTGSEEETARRREMTLLFYNVEQLENRDEGFLLAGTRAVL